MTAEFDVNPPLFTARLRLEPQVAAHAGVMLGVLSDPRLYAFTPGGPPSSEAALRERFARLESRRSPDGAQLWLNWVVLRGDDALGFVQASVTPAEGVADAAYVLHPGAWGRGYAAEAVRVMLRFLRDGLAVTRFTASIDARNAASLRLLERLGFTLAGTLCGANESGGVISDELLFERPAVGPGLDLG